MLNKYPLWKNLMVVAVLLLGLFYALPNVFGQDPALVVTGQHGAKVDQALQKKVEMALQKVGVSPKSVELDKGRLLVRFQSTTDQQKGQGAVAGVLGENYSHALTMAANVPPWITALGGKPMNLGLDLRGGIHVLIDVDMDAALRAKLDPALVVTGQHGAKVDQALQKKVEMALQKVGVSPKSVELDKGRLLVRFQSTTDQQKGQGAVAGVLGENYSHALTMAANVPPWITALGGKPMNLGLDLRGGIHVLIDVDMDAALRAKLEAYTGDVRAILRKHHVRYLTVKTVQGKQLGVEVRFKDEATRDKGLDVLGEEFRNLGVEAVDHDGNHYVRLTMTPAEVRATKRFALQQNITTIRNRVNALGVAEPLVQQQGERRIVVELPGVQDPTQVKNVLGATATLEYRLVDTDHDPLEAQRTGKIPPGSRLYKVREDGRPILLKKRVIVTGDQITDAASGFDNRTGSPMVSVSLDSKGARRMRNVTTENVGKPMAVVFKETRVVGRDANGKPVKRQVEEVISVANILEPFGRRFQTTGLDSPQEAHQLALLLRAGALAAPIAIVEERTIGPSLGADNIRQGFISVVIGLALVLVFMVIYYRVFGLFADAALLVNLVLIVAILSLLQATLTMPGIAGIVLTVGMAVDANVLIYERIREELRLGSTPQAAIHAGYEKAFSTIMDANITTLIAAVVLFSIGSGPVKGFAVTLAIGIITSMFTAIVGTRALVNLVYGGKRIKKLSI